MTKLTALSLGILVIMVILTFTFLRKRSELSSKTSAPEKELSLDEDRAAPLMASRPPRQETSEQQSNTPSESSTLSPPEPPPAGIEKNDYESDHDEVTGGEGSETSIKPETPPPPFDIKAYAVDTVLALPPAEKKKFLDRNTIAEPEKFKRFRYLSDVGVIDRFLKGRYQGTIDGKGWIVALDIAGQVEDGHFTGELAVNLFSAKNEAISRSATQGPLDSHVRIVEEGDKNSLLILPSSEGESSLYQIFIGEENRTILAGNYYEKREDGTFERIGPFVLNRI